MTLSGLLPSHSQKTLSPFGSVFGLPSLHEVVVVDLYRLSLRQGGARGDEGDHQPRLPLLSRAAWHQHPPSGVWASPGGHRLGPTRWVQRPWPDGTAARSSSVGWNSSADSASCSTSSSTSAVRSIRRRSSGWPRVDGELRREELAAVLVGQDRDVVGAELARGVHDLGLVAVDQRPQQRQLRPPPRPRPGWAASARRPGRASRPVTSASAPSRSPERGRHAHHQPPLREHLEPAGARGGEPPLRRAEGDDVQARAALEAVEPPDERVGLVDRLRARERAAGEVDEVAAQARASSSGRRPPASRARPTAARAPARSSRPAARPRRAGARTDTSSSLWSTSTNSSRSGSDRSTSSPSRTRTASPSSARQLDRAQREALVAPRVARTANVRPGRSREQRRPRRRPRRSASRSQRSAGCTTLTPGRRRQRSTSVLLRHVAA